VSCRNRFKKLWKNNFRLYFWNQYLSQVHASTRGKATYPTSAKPKDGWPDITKEHVRRKESPCSFRLSATESHETMWATGALSLFSFLLLHNEACRSIYPQDGRYCRDLAHRSRTRYMHITKLQTTKLYKRKTMKKLGWGSSHDYLKRKEVRWWFALFRDC
jgi:hypothetical protein